MTSPVSRLPSPVSPLPSPVSPLPSSVSRLPSPVSPQFQLLCRLLPVHFRGSMPWPDGWGGVDPASFHDFVRKTQAAPQAFHAWERTPALWETTPFEVRARIVAWQELLRHRLQARFDAWKELLAEFAAAGIPVIALKGFVLSQALYGDPFRRVSCDVDLLVRPEDRARAHALLAGAGFERTKWLGTAAAAEAEYVRRDAPGRPALMADLHWDVVPRWHFLWQPLSGVWERAVTGDETAKRRNGETANQSFTTEAQRTLSDPQSEHRTSNIEHRTSNSIRDQNHEPHEPHERVSNPQSETGNPQSEIPQSYPEFGVQRSAFDVQRSDSAFAVSPFRRFAVSFSQAPMILSPADMAWFAVVNNVSDYGLANLRGCVEALELLALLEGNGVELFRERAARARAGRTLAALEAFRRRFFPGSREDTVARFAPARRLLFTSRFLDERLYLGRATDGGTGRRGDGERESERRTMNGNPRAEHRTSNIEHRTSNSIPSPEPPAPSPGDSYPQSAIRNPQLGQFAIRNPQLEYGTQELRQEVSDPKSEVRIPKSADPNPQSAIRNPQLDQSAIRNPKSTMHRAPLSARALIRLALAGPTPRFLRFCAGKCLESLAVRRSQAIQRRSTQISYDSL